MPSAVRPMGTAAVAQRSGVVKFTNCLLAKGADLVYEDLWVSSVTGKILNGQEILYGHLTAPDDIIDLGGRILSPGLIDVQLNGAYGFDFSVIPDDGSLAYTKGVQRVNRNLVRAGVTSYLPTLTSQRPEVYHEVFQLHHSDPYTTPTATYILPGPPLPRSLRLDTGPISGLRVSRCPLRRSVHVAH